MRTNLVENTTVQFNVLSQDQIETIYHSALEVLERTGIRVYDEEALDVLKRGGAFISDGNRARMPSAMVKDALQSAPSRITIANRNGERTMFLQDGNVYYGPGPTCPNFIDPFTGARRLYVKQDARDVARVCDALPNIDYVMSLGSISDVPANLADVHEFEAMARNTTKPIVSWSFTLDSLKSIYEMCVAIAGGEEEFVRNPFMIFYAEPSSPLYHSKEAVQKLLFCAMKGIPIIYTPCPMAGATAPATMAGVLVSSLAEVLGGLALSQLVRRGAPIIIGGVVSTMDMSTTVLAYGAPELSLLSAALSEVTHCLGVPMFSTAGCTDSKTVDQQAAIEAATSLLMAGLSGANLVHDVGFIESAMTGSHSMLVMSDEIIGMVKRIIKGIEVNDDTLATDLINKVGPGGNFLEEDHTLSHFKSEFWFPSLLDRSRRDDWTASGSRTLGERTDERVREIIKGHEVEALDDCIVERLNKMLARGDRR